MNFSLSNEKIATIKAALSADGYSVGENAAFFNKLNNCSVFTGFVDVHVHLREPGFIYKETVKTGTLAAAHGGYTEICSMPNLKPVPDNMDNLNIQLNAIKKDAVIGVHPYGSITKGQMGEALSNMEDMADFVIGFSDDGRGVQSDEMMKAAMIKAKTLNKPIVA
ncbi:MAG: amidohydrolase family protein, partial [Clostridia bacterium]|nr:amidohydrolase family protein [Clostridia bacterium]